MGFNSAFKGLIEVYEFRTENNPLNSGNGDREVLVHSVKAKEGV
jgi:hypothetical protein